ncbi:uncharacterized protein A4U43_C08F8240 [Asparagus officinalis]|uniref:uncharacterized protein LOC109822399 n=1 Tax=Asparagus officinalis TaxID=4686 RepID=UPI00098E7E5A|nr:uncharacterized protein LOC109822399 [Asparagus officinalis]ONK59610.1 uncharacterized protein A4U43_C08F8240 [Asparagus officinalis]
MTSIFRILSFVFLLLVVSLSQVDAKFDVSGNNELVESRRSFAELPSPPGPLVANSSFILAAERTNRKDPLNGYAHYTGGWNISETHYWASVGYTAFPAFIVAIVWFAGFGLVLLLICCCYCCCRRRSYSYSRTCYALSLVFLILFTIAAIAGSCILYIGQGKFHNSTSGTLDYVEHQANFTADNLKNFSSSLAAAKNIDVNHIFLPADVQGRIDSIQKKLNSSANELSTRASSNLDKIDDVLDTVQLLLIIVASVMLVLAFLGLVLSVLGLQFLVYILVIIGWILVAGTFILCGIALLFHNVVADTCVAMDEWVAHPQAQTALDDILPCVDAATVGESMNRSREVTFQLVNIVNQAILNISNGDFPPVVPPPVNYNQSGPKVPPLCSPYLPDMSNRTCLSGEVNFDNASQVWQGFVCQTKLVNGNEVCTTPGRLTPSLYNQFIASIKVSSGLYHYSPFLAQLADCTFVRETFAHITTEDCPGLTRYSKWVYSGLALVSAAVMLSLVFWVIYARERRHRKYNKQFIVQSEQQPLGGHDKS